MDAPPPDVDGFWSLVRRLPDRQAAAVALYYLDDLSVADIADALGCAEGTAKAHLHQARQTLGQQLRDEESHP
jgi:RNA polymerase sigma-70 factor (ECF subfamily)